MAGLKIINNSSITQILNISLITMLLFSLTGCEIIGDIFAAGVWVGIIIVVLAIALLIWIIRKFIS